MIVLFFMFYFTVTSMMQNTPKQKTKKAKYIRLVEQCRSEKVLAYLEAINNCGMSGRDVDDCRDNIDKYLCRTPVRKGYYK